MFAGGSRRILKSFLDVVVETDCNEDNQLENLIFNENYKLIISIPCLPVFKVFKNIEIMEENKFFRLVNVTKQNFNNEIKQFYSKKPFPIIFMVKYTNKYK